MANRSRAARGRSPRVSKGVPGSVLGENCWAVIAQSYVRTDLTYDEAVADAKDLNGRGQHSAVVVTNEAAQRLIAAAADVKPAEMSDMRF